jgi:hypothetical protein
VGNSQELIKVRNEFYVDKITNYPYDMFVKLHRDDSVVCPDETVKYKNVKNCIYKDVDAFYIKYVPGEVGYSSGVLYKH